MNEGMSRGGWVCWDGQVEVDPFLEVLAGEGNEDEKRVRRDFLMWRLSFVSLARGGRTSVGGLFLLMEEHVFGFDQYHVEKECRYDISLYDFFFPVCFFVCLCFTNSLC